MEAIVYIIIIIVSALITFRYYIDKSKKHEIYKSLDKYGAINIFDQEGLIAILYKDRTIDWMRQTSLFKMMKIKEVSDFFEYEYEKLKDEEGKSCL